MANQKLTALTANTDPQTTDVLYMVDDPSGSPASRKITFANAKQVRENAQTGTTYTLVAADAGKLVSLSNAAAITLTIPPNSSVAFPTGTVIALEQKGAGQVTVSPGSGVTIQSKSSHTKINGQYAGASLHKQATNTWWLVGNLSA